MYMKPSKYEIYENGYQNGIFFAYIPETYTKEELHIWGIGFRDAKDKKHKSLDEIDVL